MRSYRAEPGTGHIYSQYEIFDAEGKESGVISIQVNSGGLKNKIVNGSVFKVPYLARHSTIKETNRKKLQGSQQTLDAQNKIK